MARKCRFEEGPTKRFFQDNIPDINYHEVKNLLQDQFDSAINFLKIHDPETASKLMKILKRYKPTGEIIKDLSALTKMVNEFVSLAEIKKIHLLNKKSRKLDSIHNRSLLKVAALALNAMNIIENNMDKLRAATLMYDGKDSDEKMAALKELEDTVKRSLLKMKSIFLEAFISSFGDPIIHNKKIYIDVNGNKVELSDYIMQVMSDIEEGKDISEIEFWLSSLGQNVTEGKGKLAEKLLKQKLLKEEAVAKLEMTEIIRLANEIRKRTPDGNYSMFIENGRIRTPLKKEFDLYKQAMYLDALDKHNVINYESLSDVASKYNTKVIRSRDAIALFHKDRYNRIVKKIAEIISSSTKTEELKSKIKNAITETLEIKDEEFNKIVNDENARYIARHSKIYRSMSLLTLFDIEDEYENFAYDIYAVIEDELEEISKLSEEEREAAIESLIEKIKNEASKLPSSINGNDANADLHFIITPDLDNNQSAAYKYVDEEFMRGKLGESEEAYSEIMEKLYNVVNKLNKILPPGHSSSLFKGNLFYVALESIEKHESTLGRIFVTTAYVNEALKDGKDIEFNQKMFSPGDFRIAKNAKVKKRIDLIMQNIVSEIYKSVNNENIKKKLIDQKDFSAEKIASILDSFSSSEIEEIIKTTDFSKIHPGLIREEDIKSIKLSRKLGTALLIKAHNIAHEGMTNNLPFLLFYYALIAARFNSVAHNINEINAIINNFTSGKVQKRKLEQIIKVSFFGGDKQYYGSTLGKMMNLFIRNTKINTNRIVNMPSDIIDDVEKLLKRFKKSKYFQRIKDKEKLNEFIKRIESGEAEKYLNPLAFASAFNDAMRLIALTANLPSVFFNIVHGVTSNFALVDQYDLDADLLIEYMEIMLVGGILSIANPNSQSAIKYKKAVRFVRNYDLIGSFQDKTVIAKALEEKERMEKSEESGMKRIISEVKKPLWIYEKSEEYIQVPLIMSYFHKHLTIYDENGKRIDLLDAIDEDGFFKKEILESHYNVDLKKRFSELSASVKDLITRGHGQYGKHNEIIAEGTIVGRLMLNFKKWVWSYFYDRFHGKIEEYDPTKGYITKEGRYRSLDALSAGTASLLLYATGAAPIVVATPLAIASYNWLSGRKMISDTFLATIGGIFSGIVVPFDIAAKKIGKRTVSSYIKEISVDAVQIGEDEAMRQAAAFAVGRELGFIILVHILKEILYILFASLFSKRDKDVKEKIRKRFIRLIQSLGSSYIKDLQDGLDMTSYLRLYVSEPTIRWVMSTTTDIMFGENKIYKSGPWEGYSKKEKEFLTTFTTKLIATLANPKYLFGFGPRMYYNMDMLRVDEKYDVEAAEFKKYLEEKETKGDSKQRF